MISTGWLTAGALFVGAVCLTLAAATSIQRILKAVARRRTSRLVAPVRPLVLRVAAGADDDGDAADQLRHLDPWAWEAVEPLVVTTLSKVRGDARADLVALLQARGSGQRALTAARSRRMPVRAQAAETLGVLGAAEYVPALMELLDDGSPDVRQVAARALGALGEPAAAGPLLGVLDGPDAVPAQTIAQALLRLGSAACPTLITGLSSPSEAVRAVAVDVLGLQQAVAAVQPLIGVLLGDPVPALRERAARALGRIGHPGALGPLTAMLTSAASPPAAIASAAISPALRAAAASALGDLGAAAAVPELTALLSDPDARVAYAAAQALTRLGDAGLAALTHTVLTDPVPGGALIVIEPGRHHPGPAEGLAGARAAAALAGLPAERKRVRA